MKPVSYQDVDAFLAGLATAVNEKEERPERQELEALIRAGRGLLIGAKALASYLKPRFTEDTDYLVDGRTFQLLRRWFRERQATLSCDDSGEALRCEALGIDIIDSRHHPVLKEVVRRESVLPCLEALAAVKYCSAISPSRTRKEQDAVDFRELVRLPDFDAAKCLTYFVEQFEALRPEIAEAIERIRSGDAPLVI